MPKQILLDADGVLYNFVKQAFLYHSRPYEPETITQFNIERIWGITPEEFWGPLQGSEFWFSMPLYSHAYELMNFLGDLGEVTICSSPCQDLESVSGKLKAFKRDFNIDPPNVVLTGKKHLLANPRTILIDDRPKNVEEFISNGGVGILFPQPWNETNYNYEEMLNMLIFL